MLWPDQTDIATPQTDSTGALVMTETYWIFGVLQLFVGVIAFGFYWATHDLPANDWSLTVPGYVFAAFMLASPIALALAFLPDALYGFYEDAPRVFGMSPLLDQQVAGIIMSLTEAIVFFSAFTIFFLRFLREEEEREEARVVRSP